MVVVAAATLTCWPTIARMPVSNGSQLPGTRNPVGHGARRASPSSARATSSRVVVEVEEATGPGDEVDEAVPAGEVEAGDELIPVVPHLERAGETVGLDRAPVDAVAHRLHARDRSRCEEREQCVPVERWSEREARVEPAVGHEAVGAPALGAQLLR